MQGSPLATRNRMKAKMESGELAIGMIARIVRGVEVAAMARSAGFDSLYIDFEHCSFSMETVGQMSIAATAMGLTPLVRVSSPEASGICRALEAGAQGVIVPHLESREVAERIVEAARFPPQGQRSLLGANPHTFFKAGPPRDIMEAMNAEILVAGMIESVTAVERADEIASVPGFDMLLVGTSDLCSSHGCPGEFDDPRVMEAYRHVAAVCRSRKKFLGIGGLSARPDLVCEIVSMGAHYVSAGSDTGFFMKSAEAAVKAFRPAT